MRASSIIGWTARVIVGGAFLLSSVPKIATSGRFYQNVAHYELVSHEVGIVIAAGLPWLEITIALALLSGLALRGGFAIATILLLFFVGLQGWALHRGLDLACGCFSVAGEAPSISDFTLVRTLTLTVIATVGAVIYLRARRPALAT